MWTLSRVRREGWGESLSRGHIIFSGLMHLLLLFVSFHIQSSSQSPRLKTFTLSLAFYSFSFASTNNHLPNFLDSTSSFLSCHEWLDYHFHYFSYILLCLFPAALFQGPLLPPPQLISPSVSSPPQPTNPLAWLCQINPLGHSSDLGSKNFKGVSAHGIGPEFLTLFKAYNELTSPLF